jgi:hypothetical protein
VEIGACPGPVVQAATYSRFKGFGILVNYYLICRLGANHSLHGLVVLPDVPLPSLLEIMFWFGFYKPRLFLVRRGFFSFSDSDYRAILVLILGRDNSEKLFMQCVLQDQSIQIRTGATDKSY